MTLVTAGRVGKPHGLDGSFYVEGPRHPLPEGCTVTIGGARHAVDRRAGTDDRPLIRLAGVADPRPLRGELLLVEDELGEGEWLASDLVGLPRARPGTVAQVLDAPSCSVLELDDGTLVPFISDAIRSRRPRCRRDPRGPRLPRMKIDVVTLFPDWFDWFSEQRHVRNALALGHELASSTCARPRRSRRARWTTRPTAAGPAW